MEDQALTYEIVQKFEQNLETTSWYHLQCMRGDIGGGEDVIGHTAHVGFQDATHEYQVDGSSLAAV